MKNKTLTLLLLSTLFSIGLASALVYGMYDIRAKNLETSLLLQQADKITHEDLEFQSIRSVLGSIRDDLSAFEDLALTENKVVPLVERIESAGRSLGLETKTTSLSQAKPESASSTDQVKKIKIVIETKGGKENTLTFLKSLESLPHRIMIEESSFLEEEEGWRSRTAFSVYVF